MKTTIDDHIQQLFDALLGSLRRSISSDLQTIDSFLEEAKEALSVRPQSVEEIGEVNQSHRDLAKKKPEVQQLLAHLLCVCGMTGVVCFRFSHCSLKPSARISC